MVDVRHVLEGYFMCLFCRSPSSWRKCRRIMSGHHLEKAARQFRGTVGAEPRYSKRVHGRKEVVRVQVGSDVMSQPEEKREILYSWEDAVSEENVGVQDDT